MHWSQLQGADQTNGRAKMFVVTVGVTPYSPIESVSRMQRKT